MKTDKKQILTYKTDKNKKADKKQLKADKTDKNR